MTVMEAIKNYNLYGFVRDYQNQYGNFYDYVDGDLHRLLDLPVKSINIHFPTNTVTITVIEEVK